jgi:hypothetical protein
VIADQGMPRTAQTLGQRTKETELIDGAVLHVVADELHEVGSDPVVRLADRPFGDTMVFEASFGEVQIAGDHDDNRFFVRLIRIHEGLAFAGWARSVSGMKATTITVASAPTPASVRNMPR